MRQSRLTGMSRGGGHGIFTGADSALHKVIRTGDLLFGATVDALRLTVSGRRT